MFASVMWIRDTQVRIRIRGSSFFKGFFAYFLKVKKESINSRN
jgi:hypothetical protein